MRSQIYESARSRMLAEISAQPEPLVDRTGDGAQHQNSENPNESVNEQLPSPAAKIRCFSCASGYATFPPPENPTPRNRQWSAPSDNFRRDTVPATRFPLREFPLLFARGPHCTAAARADISKPSVRSARP